MRAVGAWVAALFITLPACAADKLVSLLQLGGPRDSINAVATDANGNIIVAGDTSSFNFPVTNGSTNRGTPLSLSNDFGQTWAPLSTVAVSDLVLDASTPPVLYGLSRTDPNVQVNLVMKSIDGGKNWTQTGSFSALSALAADPTQPGVLYAADTPGIFKSTDGGQTWQGPWASGINNPSGNLYFNYIAVDPFHPNMVYIPGYRSSDAGQAWQPDPVLDSVFDRALIFDRLQPGVVYQATDSGLLQSTDFGVTWSLLGTPFLRPWNVAVDPSIKGVVYVMDQGGSVYRSADTGASWTVLLTTPDANGTFAMDPFGASVLLTGSRRSDDAGATWQLLTLGRPASQFLFDPTAPGRVLATAAASYDAFLAKLDPTGQKVLFATYLGGIGNDSATSVAVDASGNMYIAGSAGLDFPATSGVTGAAAPNPNPNENSFVAKFDPSGKLLYSTYLPDPRGTAPQGLVVDSSGNAYVGGFSSVGHPPYTCFVDKISPDGSALVFAEDLPASSCSLTTTPAGEIVAWGQAFANEYPPPTLVIKLDANGTPTWWRTLAADFTFVSDLAFNPAGDIYVAGSTTSSTLPATPGAYQTALSQVAPSCFASFFAPPNNDAYIAKLDPAGASVLAATYLGGDCNDLSRGISVAPDGSVWVLARTNSDNFPAVASFGNATSSSGFGTFITQLDANLSKLLLSSPVSAGQNPHLFIDPSGTVFIGGDGTFFVAVTSQ